MNGTGEKSANFGNKGFAHFTFCSNLPRHNVILKLSSSVFSWGIERSQLKSN